MKTLVFNAIAKKATEVSIRLKFDVLMRLKKNKTSITKDFHMRVRKGPYRHLNGEIF